MKPENGWYVNDALLAQLFEANGVPTDEKKLEKKLCDVRSSNFHLRHLNATGNVSQPKVKEDVRGSGDIARLSLTDGHTSISALVLENIKGESLRGTRSDCKAPKWISFGKRGATTFDSSTKDFKANSAIESTMKKAGLPLLDSEDKANFELQRKEIIEAVEEGSAKVFSAPKIQVPPKSNDSNVARPMKAPVLKERGHDRRPKKGRRRGGDSDDEEVPAEFARPSKPSTLFDFVAGNVIPDADDSRPAAACEFSFWCEARASNYKGSYSIPVNEQRESSARSGFRGGNRGSGQKPRDVTSNRHGNYVENNRSKQHDQKPPQRFTNSPQNAPSQLYQQKQSSFTNNRNEYPPPSAASASRSQRSYPNSNPSTQPRNQLVEADLVMSKVAGATARVVKGMARIKPTRAALTLTPEAVKRVRHLLEKEKDAKALRIGVRQRGCNGLTYTLDYAKEKARFDEEVEQDGVRIWIEPKAQLGLLGTEMDYVTDRLSSEFVFRNPNIKGTCGCGESFSL
ncbi:iron-sulfur cluster assembly accessory protein [Teladorsagia circumcincta]|uniref:Iron-sulfur cluster assembly 1 homolog, mitochondrial n=1 Tax=Teladorsagia circumcincta TaxID=45464 RepID=A0A2G9USU7_TELCI|nr:iron-sulfur cluster assembly accessory protein [Teladorsagia circumcincta]